MRRIQFSFVLIVSFLLVLFQNCGSNFHSSSSTLSSSSSTGGEPQIVSSVFSLKLWESVVPASVYLVVDDSQDKKLVVDFLDNQKIQLMVSFTQLKDYDHFIPKVFQSTIEKDQAAHLFLLSNDGKKMAHFAVFTNRMELVWELELLKSLTKDEFNMGKVDDTTFSAAVISVGTQYIIDFNAKNPNFVELPVAGGCSDQQHLDGGLCVENVRICAANQGSGMQQWVNNAWGSCVLSSCDSGYSMMGGVCQAIQQCTANQHLENNLCVSNTRSCTLSGVTGTQTWSNNGWGNCQVNTPAPVSLVEQIRRDYQSCAKNYVLVLPGSYSKDPLCVMKYEARWRKTADMKVADSVLAKGNGYPYQAGYDPTYKLPPGFVESTHEGLPMKANRYSITRICQHTGAEKTFFPVAVTNGFWQQTAQQIEMTPENWSQGQVGRGQLNVGRAPQAGALDAVADDNQGCYKTGATCSLTQWNSLRRTHRLASGDVIWDFSGNLSEMINSTFNQDMGGEARDGNLVKVPISQIGNTVSCTAKTCPLYEKDFLGNGTPKRNIGPQGDYSSSTASENFAGLGTNQMLKKYSDQQYNLLSVLDNHWTAMFVYPIRGEDGIFGVSLFGRFDVWIEEAIVLRGGAFRCAYYPSKK